MAFLAPIAGIIGSLVSTIGGVAGAAMSAQSQADAQNAQIEQQNRQAEYNAAVERNNAIAAAQQSSLEAYKIRRKGEAQLGAQRQAFSKTGLTFQGSPVEFFGASLADVELDAELARYEGNLRINQHKSAEQLSLLRKQDKVKPNYGGVVGAIGQGVGGIIGGFGG